MVRSEGMESTVILDWGSHTFRAGTATTFPSDHEPQVVVPAAVQSQSAVDQPEQQIVSQGRITNWPGFEALLHYCLYNRVRLKAPVSNFLGRSSQC